MHRKSTIIFDFDGTLANTLPVFKTVVNIIAKENGLPEFSESELETLRSKSPNEILKIFKIPFYKIPFLALRAQQLFKSHMKNVESFVGIKEVLIELSKAQKTLGIVTSNSESNVKSFLKKHDLGYFNFIKSEKNIFGKHVSLLNLMKDMNLQSSSVLYVGDEIRDTIASRKAKIEIASVTWGFNTEQALQKFKPDYLLHTPKDLELLLL